jgi:hypothetical protein
VPDQAPEPLAAAILATLERRAGFDPVRLREHVVGRYGAAAVATRIADLYDEVLGASRREGGPPPSPSTQIGVPEPDRPVVLAGLDRAALEKKLAAFPTGSLGDIILVTSGGPVEGHPGAIRLDDRRTADLVGFLALHGRALGRGPVGLLLAPARWLARRQRRRALAVRVLPALTAAIAQAAERASSGGPVPLVVCLGGIDVLAAEPLRIAGRVAVAPGGARWLADRREAQAAASSSR